MRIKEQTQKVLSETERKIKEGKLPAILASDSSVASDIGGFLKKMPDNAVWSFYDPARIDVDSLGRLGEKALRRFYQPTLTALRWTSWMNPRFRGDGIKNLKAMDLDSFTYIEPILHYGDTITRQYLEPLFVSQDSTTPAISDIALSYGDKIEKLSKKIEMNGANAANTSSYNEIMSGLYQWQIDSRKQLEVLSDAVDEALKELDKMKLSYKGKDGRRSKSLKHERVKALRAHLLRIKKQGIDMHRHTETALEDMQSLASSDQLSAKDFAAQLKNIGFSLNKRLLRTQKYALELGDLSYARQERQIRTREGNVITSKGGVDEELAKIEDYRKLKLAIDMCFVPDEPNTLGLIEDNTRDHNAENFFITTVEYGLNHAFDENGKYKSISERGVKYGEDMAEHIAQMYAMGKPEDALYAIHLLKMSEGKDSYQIFPNGFQAFVKRQLANLYGIEEKAVADNPHAAAFLKRVTEISTSRDHSPIVWGPRDTQQCYLKKVRKYIYGRMYPGGDSYIATPLHQDVIRHPIIKAKSTLWAYMTGGRVEPLVEFNRQAKAGNALEEELNLAIRRRWWWAPKEEKTKENPNPLNFFERAPWWFNMPRRAMMASSIPVATFLLTGGAAAPLYVVIPVASIAAVASMNYALKAAKMAWKWPIVNKPIKFLAKAALAVGVIGGAGYLAAPFLPAVGTWALGMAAAHPIAAGIMASPLVSLVAIKAATLTNALLKPKAKDITLDYESLREETGEDADPLKILNEKGEFLELKAAPAPVTLSTKAPEESASFAGGVDYTDFMNSFKEQMLSRDEQFFNSMRDIFQEAGERFAKDVKATMGGDSSSSSKEEHAPDL
ncbi:MAG: hypothetical protein CMH26_08675 [Micavibrio sp.]|nr:hypothetical protein [Micavibrio sp.]